MSASMTLINLFPHVTGILAASAPLALAGAVIAGAVSLAAISRRSRTRGRVRASALAHGLSEPSADFVAQVLASEGDEVANTLLDAPDLMRHRLACHLGELRRADAADRFAMRAALLCDELGLRAPRMPGAPVLFEAIELSQGGSRDAEPHRAFVVQIDESNLSLVSHKACPWPLRTELQAARGGPGGDAFEVTLLLNPMPGQHEWVVGHELVGGPHNRRKARRVSCSIDAWLLPCTAGTYSLRGRLQVGEDVDASMLHGIPAWQNRQAVTIEDLSPDGARLRLERGVAHGERYYLVLTDENGDLRALPLAEIVSAIPQEDESLTLGTRFCAVRLKERRCLADFAHRSAFAESESTTQD